MRKLKYKTFRYNHELCDFVNDRMAVSKIIIQQIVRTPDDRYVLFYWEKANDE